MPLSRLDRQRHVRSEVTMPSAPHVEFIYCIRCGWGLRSLWLGQELLSTFADSIGSVTFTPDRGGGVFEVRLDGDCIWSRAEEGRFCDAKELKQRVRDRIDPARTLGHSDEGASTPLSSSASPESADDACELDASRATVASTGPEAASVNFKTTIPILRIFDVAKAYEFYRDFLGFDVDWEHRFGAGMPLYAQVSRAGLKLHLSEHHGDASPGSTVFIWMRGIAELHKELSGKAYRYNRPGLEDAPWDAKVLEVSDPFGNRLRFSEPHRADDERA